MYVAFSYFFFFNDPSTPDFYTLSLHDALPIWIRAGTFAFDRLIWSSPPLPSTMIDLILRSEEHTSELQSRFDLVCRLLLEKKKRPLDSAASPIVRSSNRSSRTQWQRAMLRSSL